jgi:putative ABC transport system substrate-binding protein
MGFDNGAGSIAEPLELTARAVDGRAEAQRALAARSLLWRGHTMRRRDVLSLLGGALAPWSHWAQAQQVDRMRVIGVLIGFSESDPSTALRIANFEQGLRELGWIKGRNIQIHYRLAAERDVLQAHARELMALQPDLIVAGSGFVVSALLRETCTLPIVFVTSVNPVADGFVAALQRPGGNLTGFTNSIPSMGGKWLELLKALAPGVARVSIMYNPDTAPRNPSFFFPQVETVASSVTVELAAAPVRSRAEIASVLADIGRDEAQGLVIMPDNFMSVHRAVIIEQAARLRVPAIYPFRYFATEGGLVACGPDMFDLYRRTALYVDRILRGGKPADLPVQEPSKVDLVVNLRTAEALGLSVPRIVIARASEVIE